MANVPVHDKKELKTLSIQWVELDNQEFKLKTMLQKIKEQKKEIEPKLYDLMKQTNFTTFSLKPEQGGGACRSVTTSVKVPLNRDELRNIITNTISNTSDATKLIETITNEQNKKKKQYNKVMRKREKNEPIPDS